MSLSSAARDAFVHGMATTFIVNAILVAAGASWPSSSPTATPNHCQPAGDSRCGDDLGHYHRRRPWALRPARSHRSMAMVTRAKP